MHEVCSCGFPHSEISGSMDICSSPKLFAAYHVFHRLLVPRHPPCALLRLTFCPFPSAIKKTFTAWVDCLVKQNFNFVFLVLKETFVSFLLEFSFALRICVLMCSFQGTYSKPTVSFDNDNKVIILWLNYQSWHIAFNSMLYLITNNSFYKSWQPPALPYRHQYSTIGRLSLNHRVRDENGCVP